MVERLREQLTTEKLKDRLDRLLAAAEAQLDAPLASPTRPPDPTLRHHRGRRAKGR
jgi:ATP-dependent Lhr-like helicase